MNLIDTHFHLDLFKNDEQIAAEIEKNKIYTIAVTNAPQVFEHTKKLCANTKYIRPALGYHPEVIPIIGDKFSLFEKLFLETKYIGEVGLDFSNSTNNEISEQKRILKKILNICNEDEHKILTIHSRKAESDIVNMIGNKFNGKIILHYYSGDLYILKKAIEYGFYFSINAAMVKTNKGKKIISEIPLSRILTETDAPFLSMDNRSFELNTTINSITIELSKILNKPQNEISALIYNNFKRVIT